MGDVKANANLLQLEGTHNTVSHLPSHEAADLVGNETIKDLKTSYQQRTHGKE
jgi:hypothetical protein